MKPLTDLSDEELRLALDRKASNVVPSYNDIVAEMDRRQIRDDARRDRLITMVSVSIAAVAAIASMIAAGASLFD